MIDILSFEEVEKHKKLIPEPIIQRVEVDYGDAGSWKRTWIYLTTPNQFRIMNKGGWKFTLPDGTQAMIKEHYTYDGASIPFYLRPFATSFGTLHRGSVPHDHGYKHRFLYDWEGNKIFVGEKRKFWDDMFRDISAYTSHLKGLAEGAWAAVRTFGFVPWNKHRKNDKQEV